MNRLRTTSMYFRAVKRRSAALSSGAERSARRSNLKPRIASSACGLLAMTLFFASFVFSEEIPIRIDGRVIRADEAKRLLVIDFEYPATGEKVEKEFVVGESAGFKDFKHLGELKKGDLVSLDYLDYKPRPKAIYIIYIPPAKTYFTHKEVAEALLKVNPARKNSNVVQD